MSNLRVAAVDHLAAKYHKLRIYVEEYHQRNFRSPLHQLNMAELETVVKDSIGDENAFREKMASDHAYNRLVHIFLDTVEHSGHKYKELQF